MIVDASVVLKWVILEDGSDAARQLVSEETLAAPDLLFIECANLLAMKSRRGLISPDDARAAFDAIEATPIRSIPTRNLTTSALLIATELQATAYDSLYLAAAVAERTILLTADLAFARAAAARPDYSGAVRLLGA